MGFDYGRAFEGGAELEADTGTDGWDFACPDWEQRLIDGRSLVPDLPLNADDAARAVAVFNNLRIPDVPGMPRMAEAAGDWQRDIVAAVFGSIDDGGRRRVPELFALVPKKNSKTTGGGAIMVTALILNQRPLAEFFLFGPSHAIAEKAFDQAAGMIRSDSEGYLQARFKIRDHIKTIEDLTNGASLSIKTFDSKIATGTIPAGVLIDELHEIAKISGAANVLGQIRGGFAARPEGFLIFITTQSDEPPVGVFKSELMMARAIRDGRFSGPGATMLPVLYEFPERVQTDQKCPWENPALWPMVAPNLGRSLTIDWMKTSYAAAKEKGVEEKRRWASQHLNIQVGLALHSERWRGADYWEAAGDEALTLDDLLARSEVVTVGVDGGGLDDLFGIAVVGRERGTGHWLCWFHAWVIEGLLTLRPEIAEKLRDFADDGDLTICTATDEYISGAVAVIEKVKNSGLLPKESGIGFDPQGVAAVLDALKDIGIDHPQAVGVSQGYRLSSAVWGMEWKLHGAALHHGGSGLMAWCVGNAKAEQAGNAVIVTKKAAGKAKIDPLCAGFNAAYLMGLSPVADKSFVSPWDDPDFSMFEKAA